MHKVKVNQSNEKDFQTLNKHIDIAVDQYKNGSNDNKELPETLKSLIDQYVEDMNQKRKKLR